MPYGWWTQIRVAIPKHTLVMRWDAESTCFLHPQVHVHRGAEEVPLSADCDPSASSLQTVAKEVVDR